MDRSEIINILYKEHSREVQKLEIRECPVCGKYNPRQVCGKENGKDIFVRLECGSCFCTTGIHSSLEEAIETWNAEEVFPPRKRME